MEEFSVTIEKHLFQLRYLFFNFLFFLLIPVFFYFVAGRESITFGIKVMIAGQIFFSLPCLMLHLRYAYLSKSLTLFFDKKGKMIVVRFKNEEKIYPLTEIKEIYKFKTISEIRMSPWSAPWQNYSFAKIIFNSGESIVITSLLVPGLEWPMTLPNENIVARILFCWV